MFFMQLAGLLRQRLHQFDDDIVRTAEKGDFVFSGVCRRSGKDIAFGQKLLIGVLKIIDGKADMVITVVRTFGACRHPFSIGGNSQIDDGAV